MTNGDVTELHSDLLRRAEACDVLAEDARRNMRSRDGLASALASDDGARCARKASAYRHAAELLAAAAKDGAP